MVRCLSTNPTRRIHLRHRTSASTNSRSLIKFLLDYYSSEARNQSPYLFSRSVLSSSIVSIMVDSEKSGAFKFPETTLLLQEDAPILSLRECRQHQQLLLCFLNLKQIVSRTEGLFTTEHAHDIIVEQDPETRQSMMKERRWSIYLSRAIHRFSIWWACCLASNPGLESSMILEKPEAHGGWEWERDKMPPLGKTYLYTSSVESNWLW